MKRILLPLLLVFIVSFGCNKQQDVVPAQQTNDHQRRSAPDEVHKTAEGYLHFSSPAFFETAMSAITNLNESQLDAWERNLGFTSAYKHYNVQQAEEKGELVSNVNFKNAYYEDPLFLRFINADGIVQIGSYIFKFEIDNGYILQMYEKDKARHFGDFKNGTFNASVMNKLNNSNLTEQGDIWDIIGNEPVGLVPMAGSILLEIRNMWGDRQVHFEEPGAQDFRYKVIGSYQNVLFYRSVIIKFQYWKGSVPVRTVMNINAQTAQNATTGWLKFKKDNEEAYKSPNASDYPYDGDRRYETKWRMYEGSKRVKEAYIHFHVNYEDRNDGVIKHAYNYWSL